jgi:Holliday junction resolvase RusA-like endonuclease
VFTPAQTRSYEGHVRTQATIAVLGSKGDWTPNETRDVRVTLYVYWPDRRRRDLDNVTKAILDGMNKSGVYCDDRQVTEMHLFSAIDERTPRVEVRVQLREERAA